MKESIVKSSIAEMIGTFFLVFFGCGSIAVNQSSGGGLGLLGVSLVFGLAVMVVVFALGHVSGAHINPAVTIALASTNKFPWKNVPHYLVAQVIGSVLAAITLRFTLATSGTLGVTQVSGSLGQAFLLEMIMTALLMLAVVGSSGQFAALAIGGAILLDALVGGVATGASMNPARSLGPALVSMELDNIWLYIIAPVIGAMAGAMGYKIIHDRQ